MALKRKAMDRETELRQGEVERSAATIRNFTDKRLSSILDLGRYPLHEPASPIYRKLVSRARRGLSLRGACVFEGFMRADAVDDTLAEVDPLQASAFVCSQPHNVYLVDPDPAYPRAHARNRLVRSEKGIIADDELPAASPLRAIYEWDRFRTFLCDALQIEHGSLYPALHRLEREGWLASEWKQSEANRRAKYYRLTAAGKRQLSREQSNWARLVSTIARVMRPSGEA